MNQYSLKPYFVRSYTAKHQFIFVVALLKPSDSAREKLVYCLLSMLG